MTGTGQDKARKKKYLWGAFEKCLRTLAGRLTPTILDPRIILACLLQFPSCGSLPKACALEVEILFSAKLL